MATQNLSSSRLFQHFSVNLTLIAFLSAVALCNLSCSSTKVVSYANSKAAPQSQVGSIVTVMLDPRSELRIAVEGHMAEELKAHGVQATASFTKFSLADVESNPDKLRQELSSLNAGAVLICKLTDRTDISEPPEFKSNAADWKQAWASESLQSTEFQRDSWGGEVKVNVHMECKLYRLSDAQLLWVGYAETKVGETTDDVKSIEAVSKQIVSQLQKDGLIK